jgi:hypothetical protein
MPQQMLMYRSAASRFIRRHCPRNRRWGRTRKKKYVDAVLVEEVEPLAGVVLMILITQQIIHKLTCHLTLKKRQFVEAPQNPRHKKKQQPLTLMLRG